MRHNLNSCTQVFTGPFLANDLIVDLSSCAVVNSRHDGIGIALVMSQIQISLCPILGNVNLTVLEGIHSSCINIDVRIEFHQTDG